MTLQNQVPWNCECGDASSLIWSVFSFLDSKLVHFSSVSSQRPHWLLFVPHHQTSPSSHLSIRWVWMRLAKLLFMLPLFSPLFLLLVHQSIISPSPLTFTLPFYPLCFSSPSSWFSISPLLSPSPPLFPHPSHPIFFWSRLFSVLFCLWFAFPPLSFGPPPFPPHLLAWLYLLFFASLFVSLPLSFFLSSPPLPSPPPRLHFSDGDMTTEEELRDGGGAWLNVPCSKSPGWCPAAFKVSNLVTKGTRRWAGALWERSNC